jgi:glycosyltransferase involved in cell wall biosynthesis
MTLSTPRLTVVVLTRNEEQNLPACLAALQHVPHRLIVVDSGSTDATLEIAAKYDACILTHPFETHAHQWDWTLAQLKSECDFDPEMDWVLGLDADQRLSSELAGELAGLFAHPNGALRRNDGFYVNRRQVFRGRWIRHGAYYPKYLLKLFRASSVHFDERDLMDHHFYVSGRAGTLSGDLVEDNLKEADIGFWIAKHVRYAELHAREELARRQMHQPWLVHPTLVGNPDQRTAWLKQHWYGMPLYMRPFLLFLYRYVVRLGFLDGKQGFVFHFLQSFWYRLLVDIHIDEQQQRGSV